MISKKAKKNILYTILFISVLSFGVYKGMKDDDELEADSSVTSAKISAFSPAKKGGGVWVSYAFVVGTKTYTKDVKCDYLTIEEAPNVINKSLPLIYATKNPTNHHLLVHKNQFDYYKLQLPDSVKQILQLFDYN